MHTLLQCGLGKGMKPGRDKPGCGGCGVPAFAEGKRRGGPSISVVAGVELLRAEPESQNCMCDKVAAASINFSPCILDPNFLKMYPKVCPLIVDITFTGS